MQIKGTVVSVEIDVQVAKNGGGSYPGSRFAYRDAEGKMVEKGFHNNVFKFNAGLKTQLSNLKPGDSFIAEAEKEGEFWNWKSITATVGSSTAEPAKTIASPKSTYETPEERAKKQVYIIRQSSLTNAIAYKGNKVPIEEIIATAKAFESYVLDLNEDITID